MKVVLLVENPDGTTTTLHMDADVIVSQGPRVLRSADVIPAAAEVTLKSTGRVPGTIVHGGIPENTAVSEDARDYVLTHMPVGQAITAQELRRLLAAAYEDGFTKGNPFLANPLPPVPRWFAQTPRMSGKSAALGTVVAQDSGSIMNTIQNEMQQKYEEYFNAEVAAKLRAQVTASGYDVAKIPPGSAT